MMSSRTTENMSLIQAFGQRVKTIREKKLHLTQVGFAQMIGVKKQNYISRYERGRIPADIQVLVRIAQAGEVSLDKLLTGHRHVKQFRVPAPVDTNGDE